MAPDDEPYLLTPGPLTTSRSVREAMLRDWGSRDAAFIAMNRRVRDRLVTLAGGDGSHVCVPIQGSGTFVVEAAIGTLIPRDGKALVSVNGEYGARIVRICQITGRDHVVHETAEDTPPDPADVDALLAGDPAITHVVIVHCETTAGLLNPVEDIASVVAARGRRLLIDAMSAFGALPLDARKIPFEAVMASANKCLEGTPGMGFVIVRRDALEASVGNAHSLSLDLADQFRAMEANGQWRFTPPTHVVAALDQALEEHAEEGGSAGRLARYRRNCEVLVDGMRSLGFETFLPDSVQAPIIVTFHMPADPAFDFQRFYDLLGQRGYLIYPGKLTRLPSFRIGCIGRIGEEQIRGALAAVKEAMSVLGVKSGAPASVPA